MHLVLFLHNAELTGGFSRITSAKRLVIWEVLPVERLVRKAQSAERTKRKTGEASQLGIPQGASRLEEPLIDKQICLDIIILKTFSGIFALPYYLNIITSYLISV